MPINYKIIENKKLVHVTGDGKITLDDLLTHIEELSVDPKYIPPMKKLVDYRKALTMGLKNEEIKIFTDRKARNKDVFKGEKCAIVVNNDLDFGISRIYCAKIEPAKLETNVFRNIEMALEWLEIDFDNEANDD